MVTAKAPWKDISNPLTVTLPKNQVLIMHALNCSAYFREARSSACSRTRRPIESFVTIIRIYAAKLRGYGSPLILEAKSLDILDRSIENAAACR